MNIISLFRFSTGISKKKKAASALDDAAFFIKPKLREIPENEYALSGRIFIQAPAFS